MASQQGAASRRAQAAGSSRRGRTGKLVREAVALTNGTLPEGLFCLMLQPYTLWGVRAL